MDAEPQDLTDEQVAYYQRVLLTHGSIHGASMCHICGVARCPDWVDAYDRLATAGRQMGEPQLWEPHARGNHRATLRRTPDESA